MSVCEKKTRGNNTKYSYDRVKEIFEEQGCKLLSEEYLNARIPLDYKCSCRSISRIRLTHFIRGHKCRKCSGKRVGKCLKLTYKQVKKVFKDGGCELLSKDYKNGHSPVDYKCSCGIISKIRLAKFMRGQRCKKCGIDKMSGENSPSYNPNLTDEDRISRRKIPENGIWIKKIYAKNDYTCQKCSQRGGKLNAHHIKNYSSHKELRFEESNGVALCEKCHKDFHKKYGNRNNSQFQLDKFYK